MKTDQNLTPAKTKSTTETASKLRKLTDEQIAEEASLMANAAQSGSFPNKKISLTAWGNQRNLSQYMVMTVFIASSLQKQDYELVNDADNDTDDKRPYINPRGTILSNYWIKKFNESVPADQRLTLGQRLDTTIKDGSFVLTPAI
ncbi:hypothetical protein [Solidesulfovibrio magneticus]|uniref:Uncharacterized protein n=1 Tax=Solidesulfovibrio magneticus (strain ATCC 700980 / DSM 13731 / RS-1) TaxID=573370 RepID=C4XK25_SOLM1|nr:hypothetical protein [Solidesulfovibrio magneticus]BAH74380.1 hypothetical protein DMR_08890 [Solidesulfovibrio magneticus RS-1]